MQQQLTCNQVSALLGFYIEGKLNAQLSSCVLEHLNNCPECSKKYQKLKKGLKNSAEIQAEPNTDTNSEESYFLSKQYKDFKSNLSAYIDNELDDIESIRIKKIAISNPMARRDLEDMYTFKRLLHSSFEKTRNDTKEDFSKEVINMVDYTRDRNKIDPFYKIITIFAAMILFILIGMAGIFY